MILITTTGTSCRRTGYEPRRTTVQSLEKNWMYRRGDSPLDARGRRLWAGEQASMGGWTHQVFPGQPPVNGPSPFLWQRVVLPHVRNASTPASLTAVSAAGSPAPVSVHSALTMKSPRTLRFRSVDQIFELYLNGRVIYRMGDPDRPDDFITAGTTLHLVDLGKRFAGQPLYFRIYSRSANRGLNGRVFLGTRSEHLAEIIRYESHRVGSSTLFLLIALVLLSAYLSRRIDPAYPYFALFLICMGVWTISQTEIKQLFLDRPIFWRFADLTALFLLPAGMLGFYEKVFSAGYLGLIRHARRFHIAYAMGALVLIAAMVITVETALLPFQALLAGELAFLIGYSAVVAYRGDRHARIFFVGLLLTVILGLHDIFVALGWLPWSRPISFYSVFALIMVCGVILGHRYFDMQAILEGDRSGGRGERRDEAAPVAVEESVEKGIEEQPPGEAPVSVEPAAEAVPRRDSDAGERESVLHRLQSEYNLTAREARVCLEIRAGLARDEIAPRLGIKPSTLKIHLKSVYGKTIEKDAASSSRSRDKLQRLTVFLHNLGRRAV